MECSFMVGAHMVWILHGLNACMNEAMSEEGKKQRHKNINIENSLQHCESSYNNTNY